MLSSRSRQMPINRRQFAGGLAALLTCQFSDRSPAETRPLRFGVFSLFEPREMILKAEEPLLLIPEESTEERYLLASNTPAILRWSGPRSMALIVGSRTTELKTSELGAPGSATAMISSLQAISPVGRVTRFVLTVPASSEHGSISREFQGTLAIAATDDRLQPVIAMEIETAVGSIVTAESPPGAPLAYLLAQAVASRSFLLAAHTGHVGFDFCDTTHCQFLRTAAPPGSHTQLASARTIGLSLQFEGHPIAAMYCRSCPGKTRSLLDIGSPPSDYPYYPVTCDYCLRHPEMWERERPEENPPHGERQRLAFSRIHGWSALPSGSFTTTKSALAGRGIGHGVGLCQRGAAAMAAQGASWQEILAHYYPNTGIAT